MKKVIVITGASSGMGYATAKKLVAQGHIVYGLARRVEKIKQSGCNALYMDITDSNSIKIVIEEIMNKEGHIDVLFNNAGYGSYGAVEDVTMEEARHQFDVNLFGLAEITKHVIPIMRAQKSGLIINNSSMGGKMYTPLGAWYHASKHALEGFSDCLRIELAPFNINVVILEPGSIDSEWNAITMQHVKEASSNSAYKKMEEAFEQGFNNEMIKPSKPELIANTINKIINKKKPKTRYLVGSMAKPMVLLRRILSDRMFDKMWKVMFKY